MADRAAPRTSPRAAGPLASRARAPVISIGNLAMGGRGKTPLVAYLAQFLVDRGERPAIISRGYKRRRPEAGVVVVSDGHRLCADLDRSGDEPLMLARQIPGAAVLVCPTRTLAAALAETVMGCTVLLLDDGFQHTAMRRDLDIVLVTAADLADRRLPFGRLRSPVSSIGRADAVILDGVVTSDVSSALLSTGCAPVFTLTRTLAEARFVEPPSDILDTGVRVVAVAGIAAPERFTQALARAGWDVARSLPFADHHRFTQRDVLRMRAAVHETHAAAVLTTEKDAIRLLPLRPLGVPVAAVPLRVSVDPASAFQDWLVTRLERARA
ncbi:MAG: tetraacyldisaccharide 4'-kinase [Vicinamibacterales bacterium]